MNERSTTLFMFESKKKIVLTDFESPDRSIITTNISHVSNNMHYNKIYMELLLMLTMIISRETCYRIYININKYKNDDMTE